MHPDIILLRATSRKLFTRSITKCLFLVSLPTFTKVSSICFSGKLIAYLLAGPFLWVAPENHYEFCHFDPDDGFLLVISGRKRVRLISPQRIEEMYPNPLGSYGRTVQSQIVFTESSTGELEYSSEYQDRFSDVEIWQGELHKGDCLYIPAVMSFRVFYSLMFV